MPQAKRTRPAAARDRAPAESPASCELRPFAHPVSEAHVLAATERAERHRAKRIYSGVLLGDVFAHMGFIYNGAATRQLRPALDALLADGTLTRTHRHGLKLWALTSRGQRRLAQARRRGEPVQLPESPQHRKWRHSREAAAEMIEQYRRELQTLLSEAGALLDAGPRARSDSWLCMSDRLVASARSIGAALYCLSEWPEPDDARADVDDYADPGDSKLDPRKGAPLRYLRIGRRNILRGEVVV